MIKKCMYAFMAAILGVLRHERAVRQPDLPARPADEERKVVVPQISCAVFCDAFNIAAAVS
jgi:hypothetical protein